MKPRVFIGSSIEAKKICGALQLALQHEARVSAWYQTFPLSAGTLDSLLTKFSSCEFAIFVFSPDDLATIRQEDYAIARDNVLFEAGLFMGMHGKGRAFIVTPMGTPSFHMPTDLLGFTTTTYDPKHAAEDPSSALGAAAFQITQTMEAVIRGQDDIEVTSFVSHKDVAT
jgi:predicted nucleotide-binding protein